MTELGYLFDAETTGFEQPEIIEAAGMVLDIDLQIKDKHHDYFVPSKPIEWGAVATHHIMMEDLEGYSPSSSFQMPAYDYLVGHNIDYDWDAAGKPPMKRICTLALSRYLWPDTDSHKLTAMIYMLHGQRFRDKISDAHAADVDVELNHILLKDIFAMYATGIAILSWDELWKQSEIARVPTKMTFGKHYGEPIADLPYGYKQWLLKLDDLDPYLEKAIRGF